MSNCLIRINGIPKIGQNGQQTNCGDPKTGQTGRQEMMRVLRQAKLIGKKL